MASLVSSVSISRSAEWLNMTLNLFCSTSFFQFFYKGIGSDAAMGCIFSNRFFYSGFEGKVIFNKIISQILICDMMKYCGWFTIGSYNNIFFFRLFEDVHCVVFEFLYTCNT